MININNIERTWLRRVTMLFWVPVLFVKDFLVNIVTLLRALGAHYADAWKFNWRKRT